MSLDVLTVLTGILTYVAAFAALFAAVVAPLPAAAGFAIGWLVFGWQGALIGFALGAFAGVVRQRRQLFG